MISMGIFGKKKGNDSGEELLHGSMRLLKRSLDYQIDQKEEVNDIINRNHDVIREMEELHKLLLQQTEQFPD